jgi:hypothetical protein
MSRNDERRLLLLDIFRQCQRHVHLVKNKDEIVRRILSVYYTDDDVLARVQTLYTLSYMAALGKERLDIVYLIRESIKSRHRIESRAALVALDSLLWEIDSASFHFEFLLEMIIKFQEDTPIIIQLIHLLKHMTEGPSILMQVSFF